MIVWPSTAGENNIWCPSARVRRRVTQKRRWRGTDSGSRAPNARLWHPTIHQFQIRNDDFVSSEISITSKRTTNDRKRVCRNVSIRLRSLRSFRREKFNLMGRIRDTNKFVIVTKERSNFRHYLRPAVPVDWKLWHARVMRMSPLQIWGRPAHWGTHYHNFSWFWMSSYF